VGIIGLPLLAWYFARRLSVRQAELARLNP
jgi:hypothetical protein